MKAIKKFTLVYLLVPMMGFAQQTVQSPMVDTNNVIDNTLDSLNIVLTQRPLSGSSRKGNNPVLFLVGNSTMRTGTMGNGNNGQWGWGYFFHEHFDEDKITVENHALGGTSSRTFYNRLWPDVIKGVKKGDWVIIELGHNDNGPYDSGRARASIPGIGKEYLDVVIKETGQKERVYTYGEYMRRYIRDVKSKGATPILMSLTPRNSWKDVDSTIVSRVNETFGLWAKQVAKKERVPFIDLNEISASKFEKFGKEKVKTMFYIDRIHTSEFGARVNAASAAEGVRKCKQTKLYKYLKTPEEDKVTGSSRKGKNPVLFVTGDSTVKNADKDENSIWGWASLIGDFFDSNQITVENYAVPGRSARTYMDEGRWEKIYNALQPGDYVMIQFGHNDAGDVNKGKARAELLGTGNESKVFKMPKTGRYQVVYTFGWYLRKMIMDTLEKGAYPIVLSHTVRNKWDNGQIESNEMTFGRWTRAVAQQTGAIFIDLNKITGDKLQEIGYHQGLKKVGEYYMGDHTHTSKKGAQLNAQSVVEGVMKSASDLKLYIRK